MGIIFCKYPCLHFGILRTNDTFSFSSVNSQITQQRLAHTDIRVPDFSAYRKDELQDPTVKSRDSAPSRQTVSYVVAAGV